MRLSAQLILLLVTLSIWPACGQDSSVIIGHWAWVGGGNSSRQQSRYGLRGVPAGDNVPGARVYHAMVIDEPRRAVYIWGGRVSLVGDYLNDLWMYDLTTGWWVWLSGNNITNQPGTYGLEGVAAPGNCPGARQSPTAAIDDGNTIYLFGGSGYATSSFLIGHLNDLWMYNLSTGWWMWLGGSNSTNLNGVYGTRDVAAVENDPGARSRHSMVIDCPNRAFYVFGGARSTGLASSGLLNDLWMFNLTSGLWTWLSGGTDTDAQGAYGLMGMPAADNVPGARYLQAMAMDSQNRAIYVHAGYTAINAAQASDLWMFNLSTGWWTWLSGSNNTKTTIGAVYGTKGVATADNIPASRAGHSLVFDDKSRSLFMFGGETSSGRLTELWMYNVTTGWWTWLRGGPQSLLSSYGTLGMAIVGNSPGGRCFHSMVLDSTNRALYIHGGYGNDGSQVLGPLNDIWRIKLSDSCPSNAACNGSLFFCNAGYGLAVSTGIECAQCGGTTFKPVANNGICKPCPANAFCTPASFSCSSGFVLDVNGTSCLPSPAETPGPVPPPPPTKPDVNFWVRWWMLNPSACILLLITCWVFIGSIGALFGFTLTKPKSIMDTTITATTASTIVTDQTFDLSSQWGSSSNYASERAAAAPGTTETGTTLVYSPSCTAAQTQSTAHPHEHSQAAQEFGQY